MLAPLRPAASREDKLRIMFHVYDVDGEPAGRAVAVGRAVVATAPQCPTAVTAVVQQPRAGAAAAPVVPPVVPMGVGWCSAPARLALP